MSAELDPWIRAFTRLEEQPKKRALVIVTLLRVVKELRNEPGVFLVSLLCMGVSVCGTVVSPWILGKTVDLGLLAGDRSAATGWTVAFLAAEFVRLGASAGLSYALGVLGQRVIHRLRSSLLEQTLRLPSSRLDRTSSGSLLNRITGDTSALGQIFSAGVLYIIEKFCVLVSIIVAMVTLSPALSCFALPSFAVVAVLGWVLSRRLHVAYTVARGLQGALIGFLTDLVTGREIVRLFHRTATQHARFDAMNRRLALAQIRPSLMNGVLHPTMTLVVAVSIALLMIGGGSLVQEGRIPVGTLVTFIAYSLSIFWPLMHVISQWNQVLAGLASAERIFEVLDWEVEDDEKCVEPSDDVKGELEFRDVSFSYSGDEDWAVANLSFTARAGESVAIVGPTGAGKSTITALLLRFYEPQKGRIFLDGKELSAYPRAWLRKKLGLVQQDAVLIDGTVRENVSLGENVDPQRLATAVDELTKRGFPGERLLSAQEGLSAGERQLIAFFRVFVRNPAVLILDEATAHLDPWLDRQLQELAQTFVGGATVLQIAHRLASVQSCEKIVVLHRGTAESVGTHRELMTEGGVYAGLFELQQRLQARARPSGCEVESSRNASGLHDGQLEK
jgi:ABC-type multidrug transport system fused ATPase/permease subunit